MSKPYAHWLFGWRGWRMIFGLTHTCYQTTVYLGPLMVMFFHTGRQESEAQ